MAEFENTVNSSASTKDEHIPTVSIGMPVYNGAKYIRVALDSLLAQTFTDFKLVISDNASTDETQAICEEYAWHDSRIRYVRQNKNKGAIANFQFVLDQASGKFFMWAAADDQWDEHWIEYIYTSISDKRGIAGFGQLVHMDAQSEILPHPANGAKLRFRNSRLWRKLSFYLTYEGLGKANLFYSIYPREKLQCIDLCGYEFDYQILFCLLDQVEYHQIEGTYLYKRIHGESEGGGAESARRTIIIFAPIKILWRDFKMATHYLRCAGARLWVALLLLIPIKLMGALKFHVLRGVYMMRRKPSL